MDEQGNFVALNPHKKMQLLYFRGILPLPTSRVQLRHFQTNTAVQSPISIVARRPRNVRSEHLSDKFQLLHCSTNCRFKKITLFDLTKWIKLSRSTIPPGYTTSSDAVTSGASSGAAQAWEEKPRAGRNCSQNCSPVAPTSQCTPAFLGPRSDR